MTETEYEDIILSVAKAVVRGAFADHPNPKVAMTKVHEDWRLTKELDGLELLEKKSTSRLVFKGIRNSWLILCQLC